MMSLQSSNQDPSLEDEKAKKEDRQSSHPYEEEPGDDLSKPRKVHNDSKWKNSQDAVHWINLARAQDKGLRFWQISCRNCVQLCAGRLHQQSDFFQKRRTNFI